MKEDEHEDFSFLFVQIFTNYKTEVDICRYSYEQYSLGLLTTHTHTMFLGKDRNVL